MKCAGLLLALRFFTDTSTVCVLGMHRQYIPLLCYFPTSEYIGDEHASPKQCLPHAKHTRGTPKLRGDVITRPQGLMPQNCAHIPVRTELTPYANAIPLCAASVLDKS